MEKYKPKPKVINCMRCTRFGHTARLCRSRKPKCGKCCSEDHESKDCGAEERNHKCAHCNGNHCVGSKDCVVWKNKETSTMAINTQGTLKLCSINISGFSKRSKLTI